MLKTILLLAISANVFLCIAAATACTGQNEVYVENPDCSPQTCDSIGHTYNCPNEPSGSVGACRCEPKYVRNKNNKCVSAEDYCTNSCGGDKNAEYGCGISCITCSNYQATNPICPKPQCPGGCSCKSNYVKDTNTNKCVLPSDCSK